MEEEFGSSHPVRFLNPSHVKMYDSEDQEIEIPKCEKCKCFKQGLMSSSNIVWVCSNGCE